MGTAEGGKKIRLLGVNYVDELKKSRAGLDEYFLKTIHHEFVHILNQTKDYPREFDKITPNGYVNDAWSSDERKDGYLPRGFITNYAQKEAREDFAEMVSTYIVSTPERWEAMMKEAEGQTSRAVKPLRRSSPSASYTIKRTLVSTLIRFAMQSLSVRMMLSTGLMTYEVINLI